MASFQVLHLLWRCSAAAADGDAFPLILNTLIDNGSHTVLICDDVTMQLGLRCGNLPVPEVIKLAMEGNGKKVEVTLTEWVKLKLCDVSGSWCAKSVCTII